MREKFNRKRNQASDNTTRRRLNISGVIVPRPQRLPQAPDPEAVLSRWMAGHLLHPFPDAATRRKLECRSGLPPARVADWLRRSRETRARMTETVSEMMARARAAPIVTPSMNRELGWARVMSIVGQAQLEGFPYGRLTVPDRKHLIALIDAVQGRSGGVLDIPIRPIEQGVFAGDR